MGSAISRAENAASRRAQPNDDHLGVKLPQAFAGKQACRVVSVTTDPVEFHQSMKYSVPRHVVAQAVGKAQMQGSNVGTIA